MKVIYVLLLVCAAYVAAFPALAPHDGPLEAQPEALESLEPAENRHWGGGYGHHGGWGHGGYGGWGHGGYGGWGHGGYGGGWGHGGGWGRGGGWRG